MSKKGTKALASATLLSLVLTTALSAGPVKAADVNPIAAGKVTRTSGVDRYETAAKVATTNWANGAKDVVLVCGEGYADAVSGSVLAKTIDAPILLTQSKTLSADTKKALDTLKPENVYVIGGTASIAQSVRDGLKTSGYNLIELGGANRYETNVKVANELVKNHGVKADNVMVVGGEGFSDALSVAPVAAAKGQILLLGSNSQSDMQSVINFVNDNKSKATVVGTNNVMNDSILKALGVDPSARINGGADRFETNLNVLNTFKDDLKADKLYVANATADDGYADALVASALAGKSAAPLVLVDTDTSTATQNALDYISNKANSNTDLNVVGGTGVVSTELEQRINDAAKKGNQGHGDTTVKSIESVGLNQIKVTFNTEVDSDSAEDVGNYKLDGITLNNKGTADETTTDGALNADDNGASATLQDDNRTVLITLSKSREQNKSYTVSVKNGVLTADKSKSVKAKEQSVTFSDTEAPTVTSVSPKGNSKLTIKFSEPIKIPISFDEKAGAYRLNGTYSPAFTSKLRINNQNITSFGLSTSDSEVKNAAAIKGLHGYVWSDEVDLYFSSKLPAGNNTLKVNDGDAAKNVLSDTAGFTVKEQEQNFNIDAVTTKPTVKEIKCDADGTLWVRFDRPMDSKTAKVADNYKLNDKPLSDFGDNVELKLKENDYTVKISNLTNIPFGSNSLYIDDNVKDAYKNTVDDDTRVSFNMVKDETKPTVTDVNMIDSETIRVTFSKDIDWNYATDLKNYTLKDAHGVDISNHIRIAKPANMSVGDTDTKDNISKGDNDKVWDIKMWKNAGDAKSKGISTTDPSTDDWRLTGSKYTLTIKNLADTTSNRNVIDEYNTTLNGTDDVAPKMNEFAYATSPKKVVLTFTEAMDSSTLSDLSNYQYKNGSNDSKSLPSDVKVTPGNDNKSVTLEFSDSYHMYDSTTNQAFSGDSVEGVDTDNKVTGILASGLKDEAGNTIDSFNNSAKVSVIGNKDGFNVKPNTYRIENDGEDVVVKVQFTNAIDADKLNTDFFTVAGEHPSSVDIEDSDVVLRFNKGDKSEKLIKDAYNLPFEKNDKFSEGDKLDKADVVRLAGPGAKGARFSVTKDVKDITQASPVEKLQDERTNDTPVYNYTVKPETAPDYWYAKTSTTSASIVLTFDTTLDPEASKVKKDDYKFYVDDKEVKADSADVISNTVVFRFTNKEALDLFNADGAKKASAALQSSRANTIDLETIEDANDDNAKYEPSSEDKSRTRSFNIYK